jgi:hypothetical protein
MCFDTQQKSVVFEYLKINMFQSWQTYRHNTCAGFDSAPLASVEKGSPSPIRYGAPLNSVGADTKHPGHLLT